MKKFLQLQLIIMVWLVLSLQVVTATNSNAKQGHFAFRKGGQNITQLNLKPGDSGTLTVQNSGDADISDFWMNQLPSTTVSILNNNGVSASPCPLNQNNETTLASNANCKVGYRVPPNANPDYLTLIPLGDGADNSGTAILKINISRVGHAIFRQNNQAITHLDLKPGNTTTFELYNAGNATITNLRLLGLPSGMTFSGRCSGQFAPLRAGEKCTTTYTVPTTAKKNTFTLTATGNPYSSDNSSSAVLTINIIPTNTGHFVFLNDEGKQIDSLHLKPGDHGRFKLHNAGNADIDNIRWQGVSPNLHMDCARLKDFNRLATRHGFMYQTRDGTIYVGEFQGLKKLNAAGTDFNCFDDKCNDHTSFFGGFMYQTRDGTIYVGTLSLGLKKLNAAGNGLVNVDNTKVGDGFMYQTRDGTIYVGATNGLKKLNAAGADGTRLICFDDTCNDHTDVAGGFMYQTWDKTIYVGTGNNGLKKLNNTGNGLVNVDSTDVRNGFMYENLPDETIYVGTRNNGLKKLNTAGNGLVNVDNTKIESGFIYQTQDGTIYVGTSHNGLKKLNAAGNGLVNVDSTDVETGFMYQAWDGTIYVGANRNGIKKLSFTLTPDSDSDCNITYSIPENSTIKDTSVLTFYGDNADNSGTTALPVTISPVSQGHFVFENGDGKNITNLDLKPGDSGTVLLRNTGKADIISVKLDGLLVPNPLNFVSHCFSSDQNQLRMNLNSGDSCTFVYRVADESPNTNFMLSPTGIGADNSGTARLTVNVSNAGHFVFRNTDGNHVNALYLKPNDKGTVVLSNTGKADITHFTLTPTSSTIISQTSTCKSKTTLETGMSCTVDYAVPAAASATAETFTLTAKGTGADNNGTAKLPVDVSKQAKLVFRNLSGQVISHLDLNVGQDTGTIFLQNTGGTAATNLSQTGLPSGTTGTCFPTSGSTDLYPGRSCSINYGYFTTASPTTTLTATGHISGSTTTAELTISITNYDKGHFAFRDSEGNNITTLDLKAGDKGRLMVYNTGRANIFSFELQELNNLPGIHTGSCSYTIGLLSKTGCVVDYAIPDTYKTKSTVNLKAHTGDTPAVAVNNDITLSVNINSP